MYWYWAGVTSRVSHSKSGGVSCNEGSSQAARAGTLCARAPGKPQRVAQCCPIVRVRGSHRQATGQSLRGRKAVRGLAQDAHQSRSGICDRRIHAERPQLRCAHLWILRRRRPADIRGADPNGFTPRSRLDLFARLQALETPTCPFPNLPEPKEGRWGQGLTAAKMAECRWVKPLLVGQFEFLEWTPDNHLRHSRFVALREDKKPRDVTAGR